MIGNPAAWMAATGIRPQSLDDILTARPANVQDRWFARLYLIKPLAIVGLAVMALATGLAGFVSSWQLAAMVLPGIPPAVFAVRVLPGLLYGAIELAAGAGLLVRRTARLPSWRCSFWRCCGARITSRRPGN